MGPGRDRTSVPGDAPSALTPSLSELTDNRYERSHFVAGDIRSNPKDWPDSWLGVFLEGAVVAEAWHGVRLEGFTFSRKDDGWLATIRVRRRGRKDVAFVSAATLRDLIFAVGWQLAQRSVKWRQSRY